MSEPNEYSNQFIEMMTEVDLSQDNSETEAAEKCFNRLAYYCRLRAGARNLRLHGHIQDALGMENQAERLYSFLPDWAKW